jgi:polyphosphate glucokinase
MSARTLAIDIGATGLKAGLLDASGNLIGERLRIRTPKRGAPETVVGALLALIEGLDDFDRVSVGFPGVVRAGVVLTAPNLDREAWKGFPLTSVLADHTGKPVRMLNDATVHGLGVIAGVGLECVVTLGTGFGFALFDQGRVTPHLELSHHPLRKGKDYDQYVGSAALKAIGAKRWNKRLAWALGCVRDLTGYDTLYLGGGNARKIAFPLSENARIVPNDAGLTGGVRLWDPERDAAFAPR